ncbi:MAG TPA: IPT/TIG domain-containing protein [Solirubrobacteraceae bacterium]|nr:IPT/TIG domain-containing protein [Solirubrobacteraceae bacterium]
MKGNVMRRCVQMLCLGAILTMFGALAATASAMPGVAGWGAGTSGELGNGSTHDESLFAPLSGTLSTEVTQVAAGTNFGLALRSNGIVASWGSNSAGQLGVKGVSESRVPIDITSLNKVIAISACYEEALALREGPEGNEVYYWGSGANGVPGALEPTRDTEITGAVAIAAGCEDRRVVGNQATNLALLNTGEVVAWGNGEAGQLGNGEIGKEVKSTKPVKVSGITTAIAIAAGGGQNLALLSSGKVIAWGENRSGQLGDGTTKDKATPVTVSGLEGVSAIAAGDEDSLALVSGTVKGWGSNDQGQIGSEGSSTTPVNVVGLSNVTAISAGAHRGIDTTHNLALIEGGTVKAWGGNKDGELGNGETGGFTETPVLVKDLNSVTAIAAGAQSSFAAGPPVPIVTFIEPGQGPTGGGTKVKISGYNLGEASSVEFGTSLATGIEEDTSSSLIAISPAHKPGKVSIRVTTPYHTSGITSVGSYLYTAGGNLVFGRCLSAGKKAGKYKKGCTEELAGGGFEWSSEITKPGFTLSSAAPQELATAGGTLVVCTEVGSGSGAFVPAPFPGTESVTGVTLTLKGCGVSASKSATKCQSAGAGEGEIVTSALEGTVDFTSRVENKAAIELLPPEGLPFMQYTCGATSTEVRGAVLGSIGPVNSSTTTYKLTFAQSKGKQKITKFEEGPTEVLEASVGGGPFEQAGLDDTVTLTSEEAVELNSVL